MGGRMRIGIEGKVLTRQIGGIGRYAINLLNALVAIGSTERPDLEFVIFTAPQMDPDVLSASSTRACHRFRRFKSSFLRSSLLLPAGIVSEHIDVFHGLDESGIPFFLKTGKYVITIHDLIPLVLPWAFPRKRRLVSTAALRRARKQADIILVPSEASKADVIRYLQVEAGRVRVIPWGCEARFTPSGAPTHAAEVKKRYGLPDRYILFLGTLEPRKDVLTLLQAFAILRAEQFDAELRLVIAGGKGWGYGEFFTTREALKLGDRAIFTGFVDEEDLPDLYRGALLFIYPSLYEGFGLPILEAMACGTPVITSTTSSMPEVAGDAAIYVEPRKPERLAAAMASVLGDAKGMAELRRRGLERAKSFTWEAVARTTLDVYTTLADR
jgi:glycosyltransferase involved in cell wall biosynthesis